MTLNDRDEALLLRGARVPASPVVSICVPVVSDHGLIGGCLDSLVGSPPSVDIEMVVVANGLNDIAVSSLRQRDDIVLVRSAVNTGFSGGNNLAAQFARGRYLLLLNDDSLVEQGFVDRLLGAIERDPSVAAVGGRILWADGTLQEAGSVLWRDGWAAHVGVGLPAESNAYEYVRYADYLSANGLLVDRRAWDEVGGLDERYFPAYYEDVDLCLALWHHGYRVAYEPRARMRHLESQSTPISFRNFLLVRNRAQLVAKWSGVLETFGEHPDPIDDAAIDAAVQRAARTVGRVLVLERSEGATEWWAPTAEALAGAGWSVMLSVPADQRKEGSAVQARRDHMVDLGVDVRVESPEDLLSAYGDELDAVVVSGQPADAGRYLPRPFGSSIPLVGQGGDSAEEVTARVAAVVGGEDEHTSPGDEPPVIGAATSQQSEQVSGRIGENTEVARGFRIAAPTDEASKRDLKFAAAETGVLREYSEFLEYELARTRTVLEAALEDSNTHLRQTVQTLEEIGTSLTERERYIDSLPSVRVKKWIVGHVPNRQS